ncbi:hypothetical protein [Paenibacillus swuensis]|uniref:hypothetical protein n=1 Tax=Paenibacillus swuensis TaxID=1178515 RepID=UPI000838206E|nr:hypothetical protein [Paenibacillus swuensis]
MDNNRNPFSNRNHVYGEPASGVTSPERNEFKRENGATPNPENKVEFGEETAVPVKKTVTHTKQEFTTSKVLDKPKEFTSNTGEEFGSEVAPAEKHIEKQEVVKTSTFVTNAENSFPDTAVKEEFAAESAPRATPLLMAPSSAPRAPIASNSSTKEDTSSQTQSEGRTFGFWGLLASILSLILFPGLLAPAGIILGFVGYSRGARTTGGWAIAIGLVSLIAYFFAQRYYR